MVNFRKKSRKINSQKTNSQKTNSQKTIKHGGSSPELENDPEAIKHLILLQNEDLKVCKKKEDKVRELQAKLKKLQEQAAEAPTASAAKSSSSSSSSAAATAAEENKPVTFNKDDKVEFKEGEATFSGTILQPNGNNTYQIKQINSDKTWTNVKGEHIQKIKHSTKKSAAEADPELNTSPVAATAEAPAKSVETEEPTGELTEEEEGKAEDKLAEYITDYIRDNFPKQEPNTDFTTILEIKEEDITISKIDKLFNDDNQSANGNPIKEDHKESINVLYDDYFQITEAYLNDNKLTITIQLIKQVEEEVPAQPEALPAEAEAPAGATIKKPTLRGAVKRVAAVITISEDAKEKIQKLQSLSDKELKVELNNNLLTKTGPLASYISNLENIQPINKILLLRKFKNLDELISTYKENNFEDVLIQSGISEDDRSNITDKVKKLVDNRNVDNLEDETKALTELQSMYHSVSQDIWRLIYNLNEVSTKSKILLLRNIKRKEDFINKYQKNNVGNDFENLLRIYGISIPNEIRIISGKAEEISAKAQEISAKAQEISGKAEEISAKAEETREQQSSVENTQQQQQSQSPVQNTQQLYDNYIQRIFDEFKQDEEHLYKQQFNKAVKFLKDKLKIKKLTLGVDNAFNKADIDDNKYLDLFEFKTALSSLGIKYETFPKDVSLAETAAASESKAPATAAKLKSKGWWVASTLGAIGNRLSRKSPEIKDYDTFFSILAERKAAVPERTSDLKGFKIGKFKGNLGGEVLARWTGETEENGTWEQITRNRGGGKRRRTRWRPRKKKSNKTYRKKPKKIRQKKNKTQRKRRRH